MEQVPRHLFVPPPLEQEAYSDRALPISASQTISQPYIVAQMSESLHLEPGMKVLEIGTGSGYQCAVLARIGAEVYTIERIAELGRTARQLLHEQNFGGIHLRIGDGTLGWPEMAPFDRIVVTAGSPGVPHALVEQLRIGGRMAIPLGEADQQQLVCIDRLGHRTVETPGIACRFVRLIGEQGWPDRDAAEMS
jgi:protein-L-isoaspartate(D-aspartate) O-methyltransferase